MYNWKKRSRRGDQDSSMYPMIVMKIDPCHPIPANLWRTDDEEIGDGETTGSCREGGRRRLRYHRPRGQQVEQAWWGGEWRLQRP